MFIVSDQFTTLLRCDYYEFVNDCYRIQFTLPTAVKALFPRQPSRLSKNQLRLLIESVTQRCTIGIELYYCLAREAFYLIFLAKLSVFGTIIYSLLRRTVRDKSKLMIAVRYYSFLYTLQLSLHLLYIMLMERTSI